MICVWQLSDGFANLSGEVDSGGNTVGYILVQDSAVVQHYVHKTVKDGLFWLEYVTCYAE